MFKKVLVAALAIVMCLGVSVTTWADEPQQPSFEVKSEIEIAHAFNPTAKPLTLLASNELIEVIDGDGYGFPNYVFPVDTVITFRDYNGSLIMYAAWIEEDGTELFELDEIILTSEYIGKTVSLEGASAGLSVFVSVIATDSTPEPTVESATEPTPEPTVESATELTPAPAATIAQPEPTQTTQQNSNTAIVANCYFVNLRRGAGVSHEAFNSLAVGDVVIVVEQSGNWYKVETSKGTGWVYGAYLNIEIN